jgi:hypothetical protein
MTTVTHTRFFRLSAALSALLAVALLVSAPLLLNHPHSSDLTHKDHCAICALSSVDAAPASAPFDFGLQFHSIANVQFTLTAFVNWSENRSWNNRAPPAA